ncbi:ABC transporter substrate-binding protein [Hamadaea tsunoensis]|uniref:ABC transporter substrate-binding protein n=1 Tax=Hamadaea tsunoensis TaxID=53368 RepID=UPI0004049F67|nr:sugar ABC transporter substrate-binding protein [Hamadaea tsunoensis]
MNRRHKTAATLLAVVLGATTLAACSDDSKDGGSGGAVTLNYWLWDDNQKASYQACADAFHTANPNITVKLTQTAWGQYWQNLTTQLASGDAPDVWTDHASYYPQFVSSSQILDIQPFIDRDKVDLNQYQAGLADLFVKDGKRYGLPKDWDTMAIVYNTALAPKTGVDLANLTWNPTDGGSFEQAVAAATVDAKGHNGLDPAFDKAHVKVYGFLPEWGDGSQGQNGWGDLAVSNGFTYLDKNPWGTHYNFDDPKLADTITWFTHLIDKGYAPKFDKQSTLSRDAVMDAGQGALTIVGSWTINSYLGSGAKQKYAFAPLPTGPSPRCRPVRRAASPPSTGCPTPSTPAPSTRRRRGSGSSSSAPPTARTWWPPTRSSSRRSARRPTRRWPPTRPRARTCTSSPMRPRRPAAPSSCPSPTTATRSARPSKTRSSRSSSARPAPVTR